jgi:calcium permeable stress-gated cation channel
VADLAEVWIWYNIKQEMTHFITTRQEHLIAPGHASSVQATTVLITGIPAKYLNEQALLKMYSHLPGGVKKIWLNRYAYDHKLAMHIITHKCVLLAT